MGGNEQIGEKLDNTQDWYAFKGSVYDCPNCNRSFDLTDSVERRAAWFHSETCGETKRGRRHSRSFDCTGSDR